MPDGADAQVAFVNSERGLRFGQLDVGLPQFFVAPVSDVGSQQITAFAQLGPILPGFDFLPDQFGAAVVALANIHVEQPGRA